MTSNTPENLDTDHTTEALHQQQYETADRAADLARRLGAMAATLREGDFPDTSEPVEFAAREMDSALTELTDLRTDAADAGLIPTIDARLGPGTPAAVDPDQALAQFRDLQYRIRDEHNTYTTRPDGTEDPGVCVAHHDRLEALYAEAADTMAALDAHLSTGGRLPAMWCAAHP
ncbi:hypothetical protein HGA13_12230 [Nocardia speluncae]|uniref:DUF4254 domain-containing protein n=1 Tax=Nocardia speluncae TaxID=419477 RepID=A0A846XGL1_9NOCA|nr:hypothetical protein [Nocardia speluncae]NKY33840.1 hypothetical protein [Nocardia speluncae]